MADRVVINIIASGASTKGRIPDSSKAGAQPAAGILPSTSKEGRAESQVAAEESRAAAHTLLTPTVAGSIIPAEFQDPKAFKGSIAEAIASKGSTGSGGSVSEHIARTVPRAAKKADTASSAVRSAAMSEADAWATIRAYADANPSAVTHVGQPSIATAPIRTPNKAFSAELEADILGAGAMDGISSKGRIGLTRRRRWWEFGRVGDVADGNAYGGIGARAGLAGTETGISRTMLSRMLERANIRGLARFASISSLGAAVGIVQIGAGIARAYSTVAMDELNRDASVAATAYRRMTTRSLLGDVLQRTEAMRSEEKRGQFYESGQNFAPLAGILAIMVAQSKLNGLGIVGKAASVAAMTAAGSAIFAATTILFNAKGPQASQYAADTIAQHIRPWMLSGANMTSATALKFKTSSGDDVKIVANEYDITYLAQADKMLRGESAHKIGASGTVASWGAITSPFDVIRATAARMAAPKIGVGAVNQSTRAAFKAEQETIGKADTLVFRKLLRDMAYRNNSQTRAEKLYFR